MEKINKKNRLIELISLIIFCPILIIYLNLQLFIIPMLLISNLIIIILYKKELSNKFFPKFKFLYVRVFLIDLMVIFLFIVLFYEKIELIKITTNEFTNLFTLAIFYLFFSITPQEIIFRFFFFLRYKDIFNFKHPYFVLFNSLIFAFLHVVYLDFYILLLCFFGSLLISYHYIKFQSTFLAIIEHFILAQSIMIMGFYKNFNSSVIKNLYNLLVIN